MLQKSGGVVEAFRNSARSLLKKYNLRWGEKKIGFLRGVKWRVVIIQINCETLTHSLCGFFPLECSGISLEFFSGFFPLEFPEEEITPRLEF